MLRVACLAGASPAAPLLAACEGIGGAVRGVPVRCTEAALLLPLSLRVIP